MVVLLLATFHLKTHDPWFYSEVQEKLLLSCDGKNLTSNKTVWVFDCNESRCLTCENVTETNTFTSTVTGKTFIKNNFYCDVNFFLYLFTCKDYAIQYSV